jgi:hypothetical protein
MIQDVNRVKAIIPENITNLNILPTTYEKHKIVYLLQLNKLSKIETLYFSGKFF